MLDLTTIVLILLALSLVHLYRKSRRPSCLPPGPRGWPFIGNLDLIYYGQQTRFHELSAKMGREHGGLFSIQYAQLPSVMITDYQICRQALVDQADIWSDRPLHIDFLKLFLKKGIGGMIMQNGESYKQMKRLAMKSMRDFGVGKKSTESKIQEELTEMLYVIEAQAGNAFSMDLLFGNAATNIICSILFGKRYSYNDQEFAKIIEAFKQIFESNGFQNVFIYLPWYAFWLMPLMQPEIKKLKSTRAFINTCVQKIIEDHCKTYVHGETRDFIDMYLSCKQDEDSDFYTVQRLLQVMMDLFMAGVETTSTSFRWGFLYLVRNPDVQTRCRQEIFKVCGTSRAPTYSDRHHLIYTEATICEILRLGNAAPLPLFHNTSEASELCGFKIPKDTLLAINQYAIHTDPKYWPDPLEFKPERFINENGTLTKPDSYIPFGIGRRACPGESLARMELFLIITGLLQKFEFVADDFHHLPSIRNANLGFTLFPGPYKVRAHKL